MNRSYTRNGQRPEPGQQVWVLMGYPLTPQQATVRTVAMHHGSRSETSIGLDNGFEVPLNLVFDHEPQRVTVADEYGTVTVWE